MVMPVDYEAYDEEFGPPTREKQEEEKIRSRSEELRDYMMALGFKPKTARTEGTVEFAKTYTDNTSRMGRVVAVVKLDSVGLEPDRPDYFAVTTQVYVKGSLREAQASAPAFAKPDIVQILKLFENDADTLDQHRPYKCSSCGETSDEYIQAGEEAICFKCAKLRGF
jgi:hypothetical protein